MGKHIEQMVGGLARDPANDVYLLVARDQCTSDVIRWPAADRDIAMRRLPLPWKAAEALWTLSGGPAVDAYCDGADWVYCPKNDFIPMRSTRLAVTVHGAHELDPQLPQPRGMAGRLNRLRRWLSYSRITSRAQLILTVSEFLKRQIVEWFGVDADRVAVVGNGVEQHYFDAARLPEGVSGRRADRPYLLCVGGLNELDGASLILDVAEHLARTDPDVLLVVAGQQHERPYIERAQTLKNVELAGYVPAERLALLMRDARALLYLPRYETFGIAAAEAMAVGTPVITTGEAAVREVTGDAAFLVGARASEVVGAVRVVIRDFRLREEYAHAGRALAAGYSWPACVGRLKARLAAQSS